MQEQDLRGGPLGGRVLAGPRAPHRVVVRNTGPGDRVLGQNEAGVWAAELVRTLPAGPVGS
ncbi:hypothetical protein ACFU7Y_43455 [Kitasatospora sp. NPDC057542]|uniref:hypothetical protein n=1 Tax=Streptomycetaceae TaxID=2062 RepID=UPI001CCD50ED|nr:hypothetical protein [Streptomyces sp. LS1784]